MSYRNRFPVAWKTSAVRNFCEVPFEPGLKYFSIEIQRVQVGSHDGYVALLRRSDTRALDILAESHLGIDREWARYEPATAHQEIGVVAAIEFDEVRCRISAAECDVRAVFRDADGDVVDFRAYAKFASASQPMFTPAPPQTDPQNLRFLIMDVFHLLGRSSQVKVSLAGVEQQLKGFLLPEKVAPFLSTRVGGSLLLAGLSFAEGTGSGEVAVSEDGTSCLVESGDLWLELRFDPAIPDPALLTDGMNIAGVVVIDSPLGVVGQGTWDISMQDGKRSFALREMTQDWKPGLRSPVRNGLRIIRKVNRRNESWSFEAIDESQKPQPWAEGGTWSNVQ